MRAVSVIIPALNEERAIGETLDSLARVRALGEMIVVDGGSSDATVEIAASRGARAIPSERGRGVQLHAGALASAGDVLWFLHADTRAPVDAVERIEEALADPRVAGGNFALMFDGATRPARFLTRAYPHLRKLGLCYDDSGIFVRRVVYEAIGGFKPYPIFEDLDLIKRVKKRGRFVRLDCTLTTSSRRFEGRSFTWRFTRWMGMQVLYWAGVHPNRLARIYAPIRGRAARPDSGSTGFSR
jgi:rSAM/selenodomain-associated transferase 2